MGIAQIALNPLPPIKQAKVEKKCPKPSWQALPPPGKRGEKSAPNHPGKPLHPSAHMETFHISKRGLPSILVLISDAIPQSSSCHSLTQWCSRLLLNSG